MLVPIYLGLCRAIDSDSGHEAAGVLISGNLGFAVLVSLVHGAAMIAAGGILAWLVYRYLGLKFVSRSWFNLDVTWAVSAHPSWGAVTRVQSFGPAMIRIRSTVTPRSPCCGNARILSQELGRTGWLNPILPTNAAQSGSEKWFGIGVQYGHFPLILRLRSPPPPWPAR